MTKRKAVARDPLSETEIMSEFYKSSEGKPDEKEMSATKEGTQHKSQPSKPENQVKKQEKVKATFYLTQENVISLDEIKLRILKREGKKVNKSELVNTAIKMLKNQYLG